MKETTAENLKNKRHILITADWHIKSSNKIWISRPKIQNDIAFAIQQVNSIIEEAKPLAVFLLGDIFDDRLVSAYGLNLFTNFVNLCKREGIQIFYVQGQHELSEPPLLSAIDEYCQHLHLKIVNVFNHKILGLDYTNNISDGIRRELTKADILMTHQIWKEFMGEGIGKVSINDQDTAWPNIIFSGDYHWLAKHESGNKQLISPGPLVMQATNQTGPKAVLALDEHGELYTIRLKSRPVYELTISNDEEFEKFIRFATEIEQNELQDVEEPVVIIKLDQQKFSLSKIDKYKHLHIIPKFITTVSNNQTVYEQEQKTIDIIAAIRSCANNRFVADLAINCYQQNSSQPIKVLLDDQTQNTVGSESIPISQGND